MSRRSALAASAAGAFARIMLAGPGFAQADAPNDSTVAPSQTTTPEYPMVFETLTVQAAMRRGLQTRTRRRTSAGR